ncbi:MAG TPA: TIGR03667 family PPOX class F420-dependent oxidoreductase [Actinomycetota bacterium]|nr:TIGR03667 family PPOX class F420-dependent oxidoreductase [Actinomycetota bacterium]
MSVLDLRKRKHAHAAKRLRDELIVWLTTVSRQGQPRSSPVWFWWDGEAFHLFSQPRKPKLLNIAANPRVSLHLEGGREGEDIVVFEGRAKIVRNGEPATSLPEYIKKYRELIAGYGWTPESFAADYAVPIVVRPTRVRVS